MAAKSKVNYSVYRHTTVTAQIEFVRGCAEGLERFNPVRPKKTEDNQHELSPEIAEILDDVFGPQT